LRVVLRRRRIDTYLLVLQYGQFLLLVILVAVEECGEASVDGPIEDVWFREPEKEIRLPLSKLPAQTKGFA